jgi:hypothetical protein
VSGVEVEQMYVRKDLDGYKHYVVSVAIRKKLQPGLSQFKKDSKMLLLFTIISGIIFLGISIILYRSYSERENLKKRIRLERRQYIGRKRSIPPLPNDDGPYTKTIPPLKP